MLLIHLKKYDPAKRYKITLSHGSIFTTFHIPENVQGYRFSEEDQKKGIGDDRLYHFARKDMAGPMNAKITGTCKGTISDGSVETAFEFDGAQGLDNEDLFIVSK